MGDCVYLLCLGFGCQEPIPIRCNGVARDMGFFSLGASVAAKSVSGIWYLPTPETINQVDHSASRR